MSAQLYPFPGAVTDHDRTKRARRDTYADALRSIRGYRDQMRRQAMLGHFPGTKEALNGHANTINTTARLLRTKIRMTVTR